MNGSIFSQTWRFIFAVLILINTSGCHSLAPQIIAPKTEPISVATEPTPAPTIIEIAPLNLPKIYTSVWEHIKDGYGLPEANDERIDKELSWFVNYHSYYSGVTAQSLPYIHFVVAELQTNKIPLEIAFLPFIESAYNPSARSPGAQSNVGMWQIAPITGKHFGLPKNNWYDGRKDVIASTEVAIKLLKQMYQQFNQDWLLAIAAYNAGEVTVQRAIEKNKRAGKLTDFWSLPLPKTTQHYVAKIYAFAKIVKNPENYQFDLAAIPDQPYFITLMVGPQINLAQLAEKSDVDANHLKKINAGFNSWMTDPTSERSLLVPVGKADQIQLQLNSMPKMPITKWIEHKVKSGDTLYDLALHYGVSTKQIIDSNSIKNNLIHPGQMLQIPLSNN